MLIFYIILLIMLIISWGSIGLAVYKKKQAGDEIIDSRYLKISWLSIFWVLLAIAYLVLLIYDFSYLWQQEGNLDILALGLHFLMINIAIANAFIWWKPKIGENGIAYHGGLLSWERMKKIRRSDDYIKITLEKKFFFQPEFIETQLKVKSRHEHILEELKSRVV
ncbi:MAG: hypothetical protein ACOCRZ_05205 [Halothermotrichaceae bacterium]